MTSTPVKDVGPGLNGLVSAAGAGTKNVTAGGFETVWNNRAGKQQSGDAVRESGQAARKTPGESWKARDEHRARTEKREPSRDVEERADISEENPEEVMEVLETAAAGIILQVADTLGVSVPEVQEVMEELGMEQLDVLQAPNLGELILAVSGEDVSALVTNEELYGNYRALMGRLEESLQESAGSLDMEPEQLMTQMKQTEPVVEVVSEESAIPADQTTEETVTAPEGGTDANAAQAPKQEGVETAGAGEPAEKQQQNAGEKRHEGGKEQEMNLFDGNLKTGQPEPQVQQTQTAESAWDVDTRNIMRQIMDYMRINLKAGVSSMEMQLHPASLGSLQVQIASRGGTVTANFITQNEAVKAALESQMVQLKDQFAEQGIKVEAIEVTVQTHEFERNLDQGRRDGSQDREPARRTRARRINLNEPVSEEDVRGEETLAGDMLSVSGSTIDYTA